MSSDELGTTLVWREWDEAWSHCRHLENLRGQYLGFLFAAIGVTALVARDLISQSFTTSGPILTVGLLAIGLHTLSAFVYLGVIRINVVLDYYLAIISAIRHQVHKSHRAPVDLRPYARIPSSPRVARTILWHGTELVPLLAMVSFQLILAACVARAATLERPSTTTLVICSVALALSLVTLLSCRWLLYPSPAIADIQTTAPRDGENSKLEGREPSAE